MSAPTPPEDWQPTRVETYSGSRLHERPRRFFWGGRWREVKQVLAQWRTLEHLIFQVQDADARVFLLRYDPGGDCWEARPSYPGKTDAVFRHL